VLSCIVDRDDVGVIQLSRRLRLTQQASPAFAAQPQIAQHLDRHITIQQPVASAVNHPHTAPAKFSLERVALLKRNANQGLVLSEQTLKTKRWHL
jgi:hypothetical protein